MRGPAAEQDGRSALALSLVIGAILYITGRTYLWYFYYTIGVSLHQVTIDTNEVLSNALAVFVYLPWRSAGAAVIVAVPAVFALKPGSGARRTILSGAAILLAAVLGFLIAKRAGLDTGYAARAECAGDPVRLSLATATPDLLPSGLVDANEAGRLRKVLETKEAIFVLDQPCDPDLGISMQGEMYEIQKSSVVVVTAQLRDGAYRVP